MKNKITSIFLFATLWLSGTGAMAIDIVDGIYRIGNGIEFQEFADIVNNGKKDAKAVLTADVDLAEYPNIMMREFSGTFDGQNHSITGYSLETSAGYTGLFGRTNGNAVVENFSIYGVLQSKGWDQGLIGKVEGGSIVRNVHSYMTIYVLANVGRVAGIAGGAENCTIESCSFHGILTFPDESENAYGGIVGCSWGGTLIQNCANYGSLMPTTESGHGGLTGGILGYVNNGQFKGVVNSLNLGKVFAGSGGMSHAIAGNINSGTPQDAFQNNFWLEGSSDAASGGNHAVEMTMATAAQVASGETAFRLNGNQENIAWYQNLDAEGAVRDEYPVLSSDGHARVYASGELNCDGTSKGSVTYSNSGSSVIPDHVIDHGYCQNCGSFIENYKIPVDGFMMLDDTKDFYWFVQYANDMDRSACAKLTADIDLTDYPNITICEYNGTFDGQGHSISGFNMRTTGQNQGLFGYVSGATVRNFSISGTLVATQNAAGAIGRAENKSRIENVHSSLNIDTEYFQTSWVAGILGAATNVTIDGCSYSGTFRYMANDPDGGSHGGIVGTAWENCVIRNCANYGDFGYEGEDGSGGRTGGIIGYCNRVGFVMENCMNVGHIKAGSQNWAHAIAGNLGGNVQAGSFNNNFWLEGSGDRATDRDFAIPSAEAGKFESGEVAYILNGDQTNIKWYQTIGVDQYPMNSAEGHGTVYANGNLNCDGTSLGGVSYSNTESGALPDHEYDHGFCRNCGNFNMYYKTPVDGFMLLEDGGDMAWFVKYVNSVDKTASAKLTADIDLSDYENLTMSEYWGIFDGQGHRITGWTMECSTSYNGLFCYLRGNAEVKNFSIKGVLNAREYDNGMIGKASGVHTLVENVHSAIDINVTSTGAGRIGGILGSGENVIIRNCSYSGTLSFPEDCEGAFGGIIGCCWGGALIENCANYGKLGNGGKGGLTGGILGYVNNGQFLGVKSSLNVGYVAEGSNGMAAAIVGNVNSGTPKTVFEDNYWVEGSAEKAYGGPNAVDAPTIDASMLVSGEATYMLNGHSFATPTWFQTLDEDEYPVCDPSHGIVYKYGEEDYADVHDQKSFELGRQRIVEWEVEQVEGLLANIDVIRAYVEVIKELENCETMAELQAAYYGLEVGEELKASVAAYKKYTDYVEYVARYLEENAFQCEERSVVEDYLDSFDEPSDIFPNGSYNYIVENRTLGNEEILEEKEFLNGLLNAAIAAGAVPGTDVTDLMANANFSADLEGWNVETSNAAWMGGVKDVMPAGEFYNAKFDMSQTVEGLPNGIYELRANAVFRPGADRYATLYAGQLYAGDVMNFVMTEGEDVIAKEDAVDGVNCHISGEAQDYPYVYGTKDGYVPYGPVSCSYAFSAGRYVNSTAVEVKDGTLTVGLRSAGSGVTSGADWMGFGGFRLYYLGTAEDASERLDGVLKSYADRAQTIVDFEWSDLADIDKYPHMSEALAQDIEDAIDAIGECQNGADRMQLVGRFSVLFRQVYECRKAYVAMAEAALEIQDKSELLLEKGLISGKDADQIDVIYNNLWEVYTEGSAGSNEAVEAITQAYSEYGMYVPVKVDGAYSLSNAKLLRIFSYFVNSGEAKANAVLTGDIDFEGEGMMPIGYDEEHPTLPNALRLYQGCFDGQGHHIRGLRISLPGSVGVGLFGSLGPGAEVMNLVLDADCVIEGKEQVGLVGRSTGAGEVTLSQVGSEASVKGESLVAGLLGATNMSSVAVIADCYSTSAITATKDAAQLCAGLGGVAARVTNCWSTANADVFCLQDGAAQIVNCHTSLTTDVGDFQSGAVTFALNEGNTTSPVWCQTLGKDIHPVFNDGEALIVYSDGEGGFTNDYDPDGIEAPLSSPEGDGINAIYNLSGQRVARPHGETGKGLKGIYIMNGRKAVVR